MSGVAAVTYSTGGPLRLLPGRADGRPDRQTKGRADKRAVFGDKLKERTPRLSLSAAMLHVFGTERPIEDAIGRGNGAGGSWMHGVRGGAVGPARSPGSGITNGLHYLVGISWLTRF